MTVRRLFIISSLSGAGRTTALGVLSDLGFQTSDSVPVSLWPDLLVQSQAEDIALGWPIEAGGTAWHDEQLVQSLSATLEVRHLFLSADRETLQRRYSETRRAHPFDRGTGLMDALTAEQEASLSRRALTDEVVDTTGVKLADLRQSLIAMTGAVLATRALAPRRKARAPSCAIISSTVSRIGSGGESAKDATRRGCAGAALGASHGVAPCVAACTRVMIASSGAVSPEASAPATSPPSSASSPAEAMRPPAARRCAACTLAAQ